MSLNQVYEEPIQITQQTWPENTEPLVSISCITYNHENFIRDAIEGFLMQKTTFPVEILIHDDASTDNTANIIIEYETTYPQLIKPIYQTENKYSTQRGYITRIQNERTRGKYIAKCEGDDFWTDPLKLQKQVDFLENNPEYVASCGGYESLNVKTGERKVEIEKRLLKNKKGFTFTLSEMSLFFFTKTLTTVFRTDIVIENLNVIKNYKNSRDAHLYYHTMKHGKGYYFGDILGVYRIHKGGVKSLVGDKANKLSAYERSKEMFEKNRDFYTRALFLRSVVSLFRYNLSHKYPGNNLKNQINLFLRLIKLMFSKELIWHFLKTYYKILK
jgi:glycosyltransferase involved in cell wall biosynthesis